MKLKAAKDFSWAHQGVRIQHYAKGEEIETEDKDLIAVATQEGWVRKLGRAAGAPAADDTPDGQELGDPSDPPEPPAPADPAAPGDLLKD